MNTRFLETFLWVAKLGSFRAAAEKLHTTQGAVSGRVAELEKMFGVALFDRENRNALTQRGIELMPYAERMIDLQAGKPISRTNALAGGRPLLRLVLRRPKC
ncbi:LysR family transcriptional regulator [Caenimonas soli]|uniref:LysR family transcriptional regulator n=1 Tax=Caenimonas soli TaxID=2735555 RepID=UPI00155524E9|nr:LysR family transcriptional regulator [Caenimonas soli]NPC59140.1 LysR family transcriptional regulator [Caenimonas soli]